MRELKTRDAQGKRTTQGSPLRAFRALPDGFRGEGVGLRPSGFRVLGLRLKGQVFGA